MTPTRIFDFARKFHQKFPKDDALAMKVNGEWKKISTLEYLNTADKVSRGILKLGIKPGEKIALITHNNRSEWAIMDVALSQIGVITVPIYPTISEEDYEFIFNNAEICYCFVSNNELYKKIKKIKPKINTLQGIFTFDEIKGAPNWQEIIDMGESHHTQDEVDQLSQAIKPEDLATLIYTSGTTGQPKGVMLSHENIVSNVLASDPRIPRDNTHYKNIKTLSFLPICHVFERIIFYLYQNAGFSVYFAESIDKIGENIKEVKPHYMTVVPRVVEKVFNKIYDKGSSAGGIKSKIFFWALHLVENYQFDQKKTLMHRIADKLVFSKWREGLGGNIITLICGSAPLSPRLSHLFAGADIPIMEGYGLTETSPVISVNSFQKRKIGSVGTILDNLDVKIAGDGEILVKGPSVTKGYYKDEEKTREAFSDGYFHTGDIGKIDQDGFLFITDRKKEMFKTSGGKYIAPQVIENAAKVSKFIEQIIVVGDGEKMPAALIQPDFDFVQQWAKKKGHIIGESEAEIATNEIVKKRIQKEIEALNKTLGNWEQIKKFELTSEIWSIENGLLTPTLKPKRKKVIERFQNLYDQLYGRI